MSGGRYARLFRKNNLVATLAVVVFWLAGFRWIPVVLDGIRSGKIEAPRQVTLADLTPTLPSILPTDERLGPVSTFAEYYGEGRADDLVRRDMVILDPAVGTEARTRAVASTGTLVIARFPVRHVSRATPGAARIPREVATHFEGPRNDFVLDPANKDAMTALFSSVVPSLFAQGYGGIAIEDFPFRDTDRALDLSETLNALRHDFGDRVFLIRGESEDAHPYGALVHGLVLESLPAEGIVLLPGVRPFYSLVDADPSRAMETRAKLSRRGLVGSISLKRGELLEFVSDRARVETARLLVRGAPGTALILRPPQGADRERWIPSSGEVRFTAEAPGEYAVFTDDGRNRHDAHLTPGRTAVLELPGRDLAAAD